MKIIIYLTLFLIFQPCLNSFLATYTIYNLENINQIQYRFVNENLWNNFEVFLQKDQQSQLEEKIKGKWIRIGTYDENGNLFENENKRKKYYQTFTNDGRMILDPSIFRDNASKHGLEFSYSDIPNFRWKIKLPNILEISSPETGTIEDFFYFKSDTLVIKTQLGYSTILVKDDL